MFDELDQVIDEAELNHPFGLSIVSGGDVPEHSQHRIGEFILIEECHETLEIDRVENGLYAIVGAIAQVGNGPTQVDETFVAGEPGEEIVDDRQSWPNRIQAHRRLATT